MARIVVIGSSHTKAISTACNGMADIECWWVRNPKKPDGPGDISVEQAIDIARGLTANDIVAITWSGTMHNIIGLVQHDQPFDFIEPGSDDFDIEREMIPYNVIKQHLLDTVRRDVLSRGIAKKTAAKVVLMSIPPVKGDDGYLLDKAKHYRGLDVPSMGITPAKIRAKLWRLEMRVMAEFCAEIGAEFLPAPKEAVDADGFLNHEYWASDATHANSTYGDLVIKQLSAMTAEAA